MIELHPEFLTKNGQKQFAILPYEEFLKIKELLAYLENIQDANDKDSLSVCLTEVSLTEIKNILIVDKLTHYQNIIKQILTEYERISAQVPDPNIDEVLMFDDQRSQYLWFNIGWKNNKRVKAISVYVRIKNEKIYIEEDWTEEGIETELLREGVPKEDIVLAFHDPETRKLTEFAVA